ncbi:DNA-directed RNA polymerase I subunit RPA1 [Neocloeon triangulifer]|uniref:DNA-directed RNA polymerase I subunit RPA1 n=1 Tax=Neocloeon triangulifer TaxID=2078957 RepID=UPI00286F46AB|nr:DNA-directed RNA polymerase I subunit RPA1 [Neocloeon triangulifer]
MKGQDNQIVRKKIQKITFGLMSSDEIRKASVVQVTTPLSFDKFGAPLPGGLYDVLMGPSYERDSHCGTCGLNSFRCNGHMGHIELPVPMVNPFLRRQLSNVLNISCVKCHHARIPDFAKYLFMARIQLLDMGLSTSAMSVEMELNNRPADMTDNYFGEWAKEQFDNFIKKMAKEGEPEKPPLTQTYEALRRMFTDACFRSLPSGKKCAKCKQPIKRYTLYQCKFLVPQSKVEVADKFAEGQTSQQSTPKPAVHTKRGRGAAKGATVTIRADELRDNMRSIWLNEQEFLETLFPVLKRNDMQFPTDLFFLEVLPVIPPNCRPVNKSARGVIEHPQSFTLKVVMQNVIVVQNLLKSMKEGDSQLTEEAKLLITKLKGSTPEEKLGLICDEMQSDVDHILDKDTNKLTSGDRCFGVKQVVEKKAGLFRMHMMGKRVNFAARTVITPDPNLNVDEIGIPEAFALKLTFPTPVTPWNVDEMRKLVLNGPYKHPGAVLIENENGTISNLREESQRAAWAKRLLAPSEFNFKGPKIVHRHLQNGDVLLLNRQPTLHRPSIMAHKARILKREKTMRLHYANCSSYNADFDGDEMNAHFPQNHVARSEAVNLVNVCQNYLVPKNGTPLSGLIQDHVISGVRLSIRGKFLNRENYQHYVYQGLSGIPGKIKLLPPAILKPKVLWTGKQVISTVLLNVLPKNKPPLSLESSAKIGAKAWEKLPPREWICGGTPFKNPNEMTEAEVIIRHGELLCGVLDKKHYGATPFGLVHCVFELYGGKYSALLLSALAKLFTNYLQNDGFTLGVADILVLRKADKKRSKAINESRMIGDQVVAEALECPLDTPTEKLQQEMKKLFSEDVNKYRTIMDRKYKQLLDKYTNEINKVCLPTGLINKFPQNNLQLMVQSGAKGSTVNTMQISCLLGQIELEGKRPPLMVSGKSLPSFLPFDTSPRAGGFIDGRFMTGIQPQEFFFHCMAGREGLIDTAVKTSRSGYLQRCLIKHLEGLSVAYDQTVRDCDGSVIQFYYGEDGMDVCKAQFLDASQIHVLLNNSDIVLDSNIVDVLKHTENCELVASAKKELRKWKNKHPEHKKTTPFLEFSKQLSLDDVDVRIVQSHGRTNTSLGAVEAWRMLDDKTKRKFSKSSRNCPDPISSRFNLNRDFGSITEKLEKNVENHISKQHLDEDESAKLATLIAQRSMTSQAPPGEPVGILAAQSIGEPSTQMTLNTFHFAGRGDMNVTLGIPRLRELLMMASKNQKTPAMDIPFLPHISERKAEKFKLRFTKVTVADVLEKIEVHEKMDLRSGDRMNLYKMHFKFLPEAAYKNRFPLTPEKVLQYMEGTFFKFLEFTMRKAMKCKLDAVLTKAEREARMGAGNDEDDDDEKQGVAKPLNVGNTDDHLSSDEEAEGDDDDATTSRMKSKHTEDRDYEDPEEEEEEKESDHENDDEVDDEIREAIPELNKSTTAADQEASFFDAMHDDDDTHSSDRALAVKQKSVFLLQYRYDAQEELWCEAVLGVPLKYKKVDMSTLLKEVAHKAVIWQVPSINKAFIYKNSKDEMMLKVDGMNIKEMFKYHKILDISRMYVNDIHAFAQVYGIEAASRILVKEVQNVFGVYGITVDPRHLLLIADYMTFDGTYRALNRGGIGAHSSPFQQMTFESSLTFLRSAVLEAKTDNVRTPSACLIAGQAIKVGTGCFDLKMKLSL